MKLAAIVIVYNPNVKSFIFNLEKLRGNVDKIVLYQNSILDVETREYCDLYGNIVVIGDGRNVGIGSALNSGIKFLNEEDFTHVLTLDQDSYFKDDHLKKFINLIYNFKENNIGVFAPNFSNRGELLVNNSKEPFEESDAITSGSIFPLGIFDLVGGFNENLFIDTVDQEFCYRIKRDFGLKTIIFPSIELIHELGYPLKIMFGLTTQNYSSFRTYYLVRNHILLWKNYPKFYKKEYKLNLIKNYILYRIVKIILGEIDKSNKIKSIFKGVYHGLK
ncbi:glycosyltransferase [Flavobacterium sp. KACC 22761]|uniref:glycosyltransferase n=1 Tax=Flavobacterium sp. KACC 22761 TaxID=3092665 RepID=UPI002A763A6A|nr:glycosyltransferase [Flavobacterium sp. KACC 22761]WPO79524.1 glycosyltransferase [Flavobacterium sp. KACC 22761]